MAATYETLMGLRSENVRHSYGERDTQLYALSIGMGRDPLDRNELPYVFERYRLRTVPTQAVVVARQALIRDVGLDVGKFLHGEQRLTLHRPLPPAADLLADAWISEVYDKGVGRGAILQLEGVVRDAADGETLFSWSSLIVARGDGGVGGPGARDGIGWAAGALALRHRLPRSAVACLRLRPHEVQDSGRTIHRTDLSGRAGRDAYLGGWRRRRVPQPLPGARCRRARPWQMRAEPGLSMGLCAIPRKVSIGIQKGLIRSLGAGRGGVGCMGAHSLSTSEFMLSRVQAPPAPRTCRPCGRSSPTHT